MEPGDEARRAIERGWRVFPVKPMAKSPPLVKDWEHAASGSVDQITAWLTRYPGCNWGLACGPSDLTVIDVDHAHGGNNTLAKLQTDPATPIPPTLVATTQSGGLHLYYQGRTEKSSSGKLGPGIDTRSTGGYVVLPGSRTQTGEYRWKNSLAMAATPSWVRAKLQATVRPAAADTPPEGLVLDDPVAVSRASVYLATRASVESTAYEIACRVRDTGISRGLCLRLMWEHYAPRCKDPWDIKVLDTKIKNAYQYAQNQLGCESPSVIQGMFNPISSGGKPRPKGVSIQELLGMDIPPTRWIVEDLIAPGLIIIAGKPKIGKSWLLMQLSLAVSSGQDFLGKPTTRTDILYLALEDGPRRLQTRVKLMLNGSGPVSGIDFHTAWPRLDKGGLEALDEYLTEHPGVGLVLVDVWQKIRPLAKPRGASSYEIDYAEAARLKKIADKHDVALVLVHHTRKPGRVAALDQFDEISGSTGITGAADTNMVLARFRNVADAELHVTGRDIEEQKLALIRDAARSCWACIGSTDSIPANSTHQRIVDALDLLGPASPRVIAEQMQTDVSRVKKALFSLIERQLVEKTSHGVYQLFGSEKSNDNNIKHL